MSTATPQSLHPGTAVNTKKAMAHLPHVPLPSEGLLVVVAGRVGEILGIESIVDRPPPRRNRPNCSPPFSYTVENQALCAHPEHPVLLTSGLDLPFLVASHSDTTQL